MINLLPPDYKLNIEYGRRNSQLIGWVIVMAVVIVGITAMSAFGIFYIHQNTKNQQHLTQISKDRMASQNVEQTKTDLQTLSDNVNTIVQILNKQLLFSKMLSTIGGVLPKGTALNDINLSSTDLGVDLNVGATDRATATQAFVNISDTKNGFFDKADLISITCSDSSGKKYGCTAAIRVTLKTDSSFYFLNSVTGVKS